MSPKLAAVAACIKANPKWGRVRIARETKLGLNTVKWALEELRRTDPKPEDEPIPIREQIKTDLEKSRHDTVVQSLRQQVNALKDEVLQWQDVAGLTQSLALCKAPEIIVKRTSGFRSESVAVAVGSDLHIEETVTPESVNGLNQFRMEQEGKARLDTFFRNVVELIEIQRHGTKINTMVLGLLGDLISGYIHPELEETNECAPIPACMWLLPQLEAGINYLLEHSGVDRLIVVCCCGNHGRTTDKLRNKSLVQNSFELWVYMDLVRAFRNNPKVEFRIAQSYFVYTEIFGRVIRWHHGDSIKYWGGVGGLTIPANKAIAEWNKGRPAYLDVFGHWHQFLATRQFVSNGSLIGYSSFAIKIKAPFEPPTQTFFLIEKDWGRTITTPVFLTDQKPSKKQP